MFFFFEVREVRDNISAHAAAKTSFFTLALSGEVSHARQSESALSIALA